MDTTSSANTRWNGKKMCLGGGTFCGIARRRRFAGSLVKMAVRDEHGGFVTRRNLEAIAHA